VLKINTYAESIKTAINK